MNSYRKVGFYNKGTLKLEIRDNGVILRHYDGNVRPGYKNTIKKLKPHPDKDGYLKVKFLHEGRRYNLSVHRLLAITFIPNPNNKPITNHKNGIKNDNSLSNLEWVTYSENNYHAYETGLSKVNLETRPARRSESLNVNDIDVSLLTPDQSETVLLAQLGYKNQEIADILKVNRTTIKGRIQKARTRQSEFEQKENEKCI